MRSASAAASAMRSTIAAPMAPIGLRRRKSRVAAVHARRRDASTGPSRSTVYGVTAIASPVPDPGIEPGIEHVDDEVGDHEYRCDDEDERLHERVVVVSDGVDEQLAEPVEVEDLFGHHQPAQQEGELEAHHGEDGQHRILERVAPEDQALPEALRPRGADVVLAE